jgi:predicted thioesterase
MLTPSQSAIVTETLRVSLAAAAGDVDEASLGSLAEAAAALAPTQGDASAPGRRGPHPAWPTVGSSVVRDLVVGPGDTAAAMGHPDTEAHVLGSPRLALWFELVSCDLLAAPSPGLTHVGVGILVHHLDRSDVGDTVTVESTVASVQGRRGVFACRATTGERVVGLGVHQRALVEAR